MNRIIKSPRNVALLLSLGILASGQIQAQTATLEIQENGSGFCGVDGIIESEHTGFTGSGYANTDNATGQAVDWSITVPNDGAYTFTIRYANGASDNRPGMFNVNGSDDTSINLPATGAWTNYSDASASVFLNGGTNSVSLVSTGSTGLANIDRVQITGLSPQAGNCGGQTNPTPTPTTTPTTTPTPTPVPTTDPGNGQTDGNAAGVVGFASISGMGRTGTNGGQGGQVVTVNNYNALVDAIADSAPRVVQISGTISGAGPMIRVGSNKTIIGLGGNATISGFGFDINGSPVDNTCDEEDWGTFTPVENVIIRNLHFTNSSDDSINLQCWSHHVWVDHNSFYPSYDGSVDIKRGSDMVTVSYNRFLGTDKSMLLGHSTGSNSQVQDPGHLRVTYHHNWLDGSNTRHPRVRFGYAHLYNNYYDITDYAIGLGINASIYADGNNIVRTKTITQQFSTGYHLTWHSSNLYNTATITRANDSQKVMSDWLDADGQVPPPPYSYQRDSAPTSPPAAGAGLL